MIKLSYAYIACNTLVKTKQRNDNDFMCKDTGELTYTNSVTAPNDGDRGCHIKRQH